MLKAEIRVVGTRGLQRRKRAIIEIGISGGTPLPPSIGKQKTAQLKVGIALTAMVFRV
jgi:hypothetical protein